MPRSIRRPAARTPFFAQRRARRLLVVVECPRIEEELREKLRCPAEIPIRCEHAEDLSAGLEALSRREFDVVMCVTLGRDPSALLAVAKRTEAKTVVIGETADEVVQALDAGADLAFERARLPLGILPHILDVELDDEAAFSTMELDIPREGRD
jgi:hypothetical protein